MPKNQAIVALKNITLLIISISSFLVGKGDAVELSIISLINIKKLSSIMFSDKDKITT